MGKRLFIDPEFTTLKAKHAERTEKKKGRGNKLNATTALSEEEIDISFDRRSWEQVLHNRY